MKDEVLANFYANFALIWLTIGFVGPLFSPIENKAIFTVKLLLTIVISKTLLQRGLNKIK